jgi:hypothetical protein
MELDDVDGRLPDNPRHLSRQRIDEHADCQHGSVWGGIPSGSDAGSRRCSGNLASGWRKYEPDQVGSGGRRCRRVLRFTQAADLHDIPPSEEPCHRLMENG